MSREECELCECLCGNKFWGKKSDVKICTHHVAYPPQVGLNLVSI